MGRHTTAAGRRRRADLLPRGDAARRLPGGRAARTTPRRPAPQWGDAKADSQVHRHLDRRQRPEEGPGFALHDHRGHRGAGRLEAQGRRRAGPSPGGASRSPSSTPASRPSPAWTRRARSCRGRTCPSRSTPSRPITDTDTYGHGTHMAGIIAAKDAVEVDAKTGEPKPSKAYQQLGIAPDAQVLGLKLASTDGSTDVSQVIAALDWVVQHQRRQRHGRPGGQPVLRDHRRCRTTRSTRSPPRPRTPGTPASSSSCPAATTAAPTVV